MNDRSHLLVLGDRVEQLDVQLGVVLRQRLVAVVVDELHHRAEGERVGEAVLALPVEDLDQLVVASFPAGGAEGSGGAHTAGFAKLQELQQSPRRAGRTKGAEEEPVRPGRRGYVHLKEGGASQPLPPFLHDEQLC